VKAHPDFEQQLRDVIEQSRTDSNAAIAATNAITILVKAGVSFHGADLRGVKIPGADLSDGQFDSVHFQDADLRGVKFSRSWMRQMDLSGAQLEGAEFGELPYLVEESFVNACAYSPDGQMFGAALSDGCLAIYNTSTWTRIHYIQQFGQVHDIHFSPDNQRWVSSGDGYTIRLWDCTSGEEVLVMKGHKYDLNSIVFSPCGTRIASASSDRTVRLWNSQTGECLFVLVGHTRCVNSVKFSPDGRQLISCSMDGTIRFWSQETGEPGVVLGSLLDAVYSMAYSPDGRRIASGHKMGALVLWNTLTKEPGPILRGHTKTVTHVTFSADGQLIASSSDDKTIRLWDAPTGVLMSILTAHKEHVRAVTFSPNDLQLASGGLDSKVRLWDVKTCLSSVEVPGQTTNVLKLGYSLDGQTILSHSRHTVRQWNSETGVDGSVVFDFQDILSIGTKEFPPDGNQVANGSRDRDIRKNGRKNGGAITGGWSEKVDVMSYSPCCRWVAFSDWDNVVRLKDFNDPEHFHTLLELNRSVKTTIGAIAFSGTGHLLVIGSWNGRVWLVDPQTSELLASSRPIKERILVATFSPNGQQLALGSDSSIYLWDLQSKTPRIKLRGHSDITISLAYSPCSQWLASGSEDNTVRLWHRQQPLAEKEHWSCVSVLGGFFGAVHDVVWNPVTPMEFVTACKDGSIRVWRVTNDDGGDGVLVKMLWGSNIRTLCALDLVFKDAIGLSAADQRLLTQRGAVVDPTLVSKVGGASAGTLFFEEEEDDGNDETSELLSSTDEVSDEDLTSARGTREVALGPVMSRRRRTPRITLTRDSGSESSSDSSSSSDEEDLSWVSSSSSSSSSSDSEREEVKDDRCQQM
jgi:WD40 repeat protein